MNKRIVILEDTYLDGRLYTTGHQFTIKDSDTLESISHISKFHLEDSDGNTLVDTLNSQIKWQTSEEYRDDRLRGWSI